MTYSGRHIYLVYKPEELSRQNSHAYMSKMREIASWISEQKWDHWGGVDGGFYFDVEENYNWTVLRFGAGV